MTGACSCLVAMVLALGVISPLEAQLAGSCFDATLGPWSTPELSPDSIYHAFPPRVQLTDLDPIRGGADWRRAVVPEGSLPVPKPLLSWRSDGDRLAISVTDGLTGSRAELRRADDRWIGEVFVVTDIAGTTPPSRPAELREVDCESPPPVPASADVPLLRAVPVEEGPPLRLGEPVPEDYVVRPIRSWAWVDGVTPSGFWAGADTVFVRRTSDGRIERIEVRFPDDFDPGPVHAGLVASMGPTSPEVGSWVNRTTSVFIRRDWRPKVLLRDPRLRGH